MRDCYCCTNELIVSKGGIGVDANKPQPWRKRSSASFDAFDVLFHVDVVSAILY